MKQALKKAIALLLTMLLAINSVPVAAFAGTETDTEEVGPLLRNAPSSRPHYLTINLEEGQDSITLKEIAEAAGEEYTDDLSMYYQSPDTIGFTDNWKTLTNLTSIPAGSNGSVSVYDWAGDGEWAIYVTFVPPVEKKYYAVTETGTVSLADILDAAGITVSTYGSYYLIQDDSSADYSAVAVSNLDHTVHFQSTDIPEAGLRYRLNANGGEPCPFKLVFIGDNAPQNANDGIFTYALDQAKGTATITGFVSGLSNADKANITIPASMTWPKNNGTEYTVTGIANSAFTGNTAIKTVTVAALNLNVGDHAFENCTAMTSFSDPNTGGVLTVGEYAFSGCTALKTFSSDAGIDKIKDKAFYNTYRLESLTAGANKKTEIVSYSWGYSNAFQRCSGVLEFKGGISRIPPYTFHEATVSKVITTSLENCQGTSLSTAASSIDLELNVSRIDNGTLTSSVLTDDLLKYASGFKNITVNLKQGVTAVSADAFSSFPFSSYESLTVNVDTEENDAEITVAEGAVPADQPKLQVNFCVPRENVAGADKDPLPALEAAGQVTYLTVAPVDNRLHDDLFWYETENGKAHIVGLYDAAATELGFTGASQGDVYTADGTLLENVSLNVVGITSLSDEEKENITSVTINSNKAFTVADGALSNMPALKTLTVSNGNAALPEGAFAGCTALETVVIGTSENQSGTAAIPADAFDGCSALKSFTCNLSVSEVPAGAFDGCTALETVSFTGKGSQTIESGAFSGAEGIGYLRLDNPYNVENGAFAVSGGTTFVQNNDTALNNNLAAKIGVFENYVFTGYPWWMNSNAFSGNNAPERVYLKFTDGAYADYVVNAIRNAGSNLTDVYMDCAREEVSFADDLDEANPNVTIHYRVNHISTGCYIDGVNGNDENDGSHDAPVKTFERAKEVIAAMPTEPTEVEDVIMSGVLADACPKIGMNATPGTFTDIIEPAPQAFVLNTLTVSGTETWDSGEGETVILIRDPSFTGFLVDVTGSLTLKNVVLDGNRTNVTAQAAMINAESGSTLTLDSGSVLRNNDSPDAAWINSEWENGGAVFAKNATVNIKDGSLIDNNQAMYGGGVQMYGGTLNMTGGTVSNNTAQARRYINNLPVQGNGGGILLTHGAVMNLSGGTVTGNYAKGYESVSTIGVNGSTGGGIQVGASYNDLNSESQLFMTGGTVSNNRAHAEGGGICIQDSCTGTITAGQIINNQSLVDGGYVDSFGGGGIYVNAARSGTRNGLLKLNNVLITENEAYSGGGGIACCETVNLTLAMGNGAAIFNNHITGKSGEHDLLLFYRGYGSSPGTKAKLSFYMMNGAEYNWTHVVTQYDKDVYDCPFNNGEPASEELISYVNVGSVGCDVKLKSNPSNTSVDAKVIISGNKANAKGGGIGSNGNIIIGDVPPTSDVTMTPVVSKMVVGRDMKDNEAFQFTVYLEESTSTHKNGNIEYTYTDTLLGNGSVTMGEDGVPKEIDLPDYTVKNVNSDKLGTKITLLVLEDTRSTDEMIADESTYFAVHFVIGQGIDSQGKGCYKAYQYKIEKGTYIRDENGDPQFNYGEDRVPGYVPFIRRIRQEIPAEDAYFVNYLSDIKHDSVTVNKKDGEKDLKGAIFTLYDGEGKKIRDYGSEDASTFEIKTEDEELATCLPTTDGGSVTLKLKEKSAPAGYKLSTTEYNVVITAKVVVYPDKDAAKTVTVTTYSMTIGGKESIDVQNTPETVTVSGEKTWDLKGYSESLLPESITVYVKDGETTVDTLTVKPGTDKSWKYVSKALPKYRADGTTVITYTVEEEPIPGFTPDVTGQDIKNTYETVTVSGEKTWDLKGYSESLLPESITVYVKDGETMVDTLTVKPGTDKTWKYVSKALPKYRADGTTVITYTVEEEPIPGFKPDVTGQDIKNTYETVTVSGEKTWDLKGYSESLLPESITVYVKDGETTVDTLTVKPGTDKSWKYVSKALPKYRADGTTVITYTVEEEPIPGFTPDVTGQDIKNTYETVTVSGEKTWDLKGYSESLLPESITVYVKDGETTVDTLTVKPGTDKSWKYVSKALPKYRADGTTVITYTVEEEPIPGFTPDVTGQDIKNTYETVTVSGEKTWDLKGYSESLLPESITVYVKDGETTVDTLTVKPGTDKSWKYVSKALPKYRADGTTVITYTVEEEPIPGFTPDVTGQDIKNTYETVTVSGEKTWDLKGYSESLLPESITVYVKDGETTVDTLTVKPGTDKSWKYVSKALPKYRADGTTVITYTVEEEPIPGFTPDVTGQDIKNTYETVTVSGEKTWDLKGYSESLLPESITVYVKDGETTVDTLTVKPGTDKTWKYVSKALPKYRADGTTVITYTVEEEPIPGFTPDVTGQDIKNTYETVTVSGEKTWDLKGYSESLLPESITVYVKDGETTVDTLNVTAGADEKWTFESKELPKYRADGKTEITYTVDEEAVPGFEKNVADHDITNTYIPEMITVSGKKTWDLQGYDESLMPASITVYVKDGDTIVDTLTVTAGADKSWKYESKELPKHRTDGKTEITYTVDEETVPGFRKIVIGHNITNRYISEKIKVSGEKTWDLQGYDESLLPESITVYVKDGEATVDTLTVTAGADKSWKYESKELPNYRTDGKTEIIYTVDEEAVTGFRKVVTDYYITNTYIPEMTKVTGEKTWDLQGYDESLLPASITVYVKDGETTVDTLTVTAGDDKSWKYVSKELPKYRADGKTEITYTVDEKEIPGFEKTIAGHSISNRYIPEMIRVSGKKTWDLQGYDESLLPESITVYVKDGETTVDTLTVTAGADKSWKYESKELPKYRADGKTEIIYTVDEKEIPGFEKTIAGHSISNKYIPELIRVSGKKTWDLQGYDESLLPESITVYVKDGETTVDTLTVTAGADKSWKYESKELPKYRADGKTEIIYTVDEKEIPGFEKTIAGHSISNKYIPELIRVSGEKSWDLQGYDESLLPASITVYVKDGDTTVDTLTVTAGEDKTWKFESKDLPKYRKDGKTEITYTVDEEAVTGFEKTVTGHNISNKYIPEMTKVEGEKTWDLQGYDETLLPESITVYVKDGTKTVDTLTVTAGEDKTWKYESKELPKYRTDGKTEITYTVDEEAVTGFNKVVTGYNITNTYIPEMTKVEGEKTWDLQGYDESLLPASITVYVKDGDTTVDTLTVTAGEDKTWKFESKDLPKYRKDGKTEITYTVDEEAVTGFEKTVTGHNISNKYIPEMTKVEGEKTWDLQGYDETLLPESITVYVKDGTKTVDTLTVTAGEDKTWKYESKELPKYRTDGKTEITYTVDEEAVTGFNKVVTGYNITNTYIPEMTKVEGEKTWDLQGYDESLLPASITVYVKDGDTTVDTLTVTAGEDKTWKFESKDLPKYRKDGKTEITYTVDEEAVTGFEKTVTGHNISNKYIPEMTKVEGEKTWDLQGYDETLLPESITVYVKDGTKTVDTLTVTAGEDKTWKYESKELPKYRTDGKTEITYTVDEEAVTGFNKVVTGYNITNTYIPEMTKVEGEKTWDLQGYDESLLPESITVYVKDGTKTVDTLTVTAGEDKTWKYESKDLPKYRTDGKTEITYTVDEEAVTGFEKTVTGHNISNKYIPEMIKVSGEKTWDLQGYDESLLPESITVYVKDGETTVDTLTVTAGADKTWKYESKELPKYRADGKTEITYTVDEEAVTGFNKVVTGYNITNTYIPEMTKVEGEKTWDLQGYDESLLPESITVYVKDGTKTVDTLTVTAGEDKTWKYESKELPKHRTDGKTEITYTVEEEPIAGFATVVNDHDITNTYIPEMIRVSGKKAWDLQGYDESLLPESITVYVKDGETTVDTLTVTAGADKSWKYESKELPKYRADGKTEITYTVDEEAVTGFEKTVTGHNISNKYIPEMIKVSGEKTWDLQGYDETLLPESITVYVKDGETTVDTLTVTAGADKTWKYESKELPKYRADGKTEIAYTVDEKAVPGFRKAVTDHSITNTYIPEMIKVSGKKTWDLQGYDESLLPASITVYVKDGGTTVDTLTVTAGADKSWTFESKELPKYRTDGKTEIDYTVDEEAVPGFEKTVTSHNISNRYIPELIRVSGEKTWDLQGYDESLLPESITVYVKDGETTVDTLTVTAGADKSWKFESKELPKYRADGKTEITYTVDEEAVSGFEKTVTGLNIKNTLITGSLIIQKTFIGTDAIDKKVLDQLSFVITGPNGYKKEITYKQFTNGRYVLHRLIPGKYTVSEVNAGTLIAEYTLNAASKTDGQATVKAKETATIKLTNQYNRPEDTPPPPEDEEPGTVSVTVTKKWEDRDNLDGSRPEKLVVYLLADGKVTEVAVLNEENGWSCTVDNLPEKDDKGNTIHYRWQEVDATGYTGTVTTDGYTTEMVNTHEPELTSVTVKKVWDDNDDEQHIRPKSIVMKLSNGMTVVLSEENGWTATITDLPVYYQGEKIIYTWKECTVLGYVTSDVSTDGSVTTVTNTVWKRPEEPEQGKKPKVPGKTIVSVDEYDTPLGIDVIINHVGDCFD